MVEFLGGDSMDQPEKERLVNQRQIAGDSEDGTLRPRFLSDFIGQTKIRENMRVFIEAARERGDSLDHVLLYGPPGLGKTSLAYIVANELGVGIHTTSGPAIEKQGDLVAMLTSLECRDVLFIDEIHRLNRTVEEVLYPAMEDLTVDIMIGKGPGARSVRLDLEPFTLIGATTRAGMLTSPLRDRFGVIMRLDFYSPAELTEIVLRSARILEIQVDEEGAAEIAFRSRGTPRVANRLLKRARDYAQVKGNGIIDRGTARRALSMLEIDESGLDRVDRKVLRAIIDKFSGGPVGINTIAAAVNEEVRTIEDMCEPFLLQLGYLKRTPRGREVTDAACRHLGLNPPRSAPGDTACEQQSLWSE